MPSTHLLKAITADYPEISFIKSAVFSWSSQENIIHFNAKSPHASAFLLHELGHAVLGHSSYKQDISLLKIERDAWHIASTALSDRYKVEVSDLIIQETLDTYRDWLHKRSLCPTCHVSGLQTFHGNYLCIACGCRWKTNEARTCALRRVKIKQ